MRDKGKSYVYILTNKSFRDNLLKIGVSDKPMDELIEWLDNEDLPDPYDPFAIVQTEEANMLENAFIGCRTISRIATAAANLVFTYCHLSKLWEACLPSSSNSALRMLSC